MLGAGSRPLLWSGWWPRLDRHLRSADPGVMVDAGLAEPVVSGYRCARQACPPAGSPSSAYVMAAERLRSGPVDLMRQGHLMAPPPPPSWQPAALDQRAKQDGGRGRLPSRSAGTLRHCWQELQ
jgi:hypothetical protein